MTVYVDHGKNPYGRMLMCHMLADSIDELHAMADKIGIRRKWFQNESIPHYDISQSKRKLALEAGAIEIDKYKLMELIKTWRNEPRKLCPKCGARLKKVEKQNKTWIRCQVCLWAMVIKTPNQNNQREHES